MKSFQMSVYVGIFGKPAAKRQGSFVRNVQVRLTTGTMVKMSGDAGNVAQLQH